MLNVGGQEFAEPYYMVSDLSHIDVSPNTPLYTHPIAYYGLMVYILSIIRLSLNSLGPSMVSPSFSKSRESLTHFTNMTL